MTGNTHSLVFGSAAFPFINIMEVFRQRKFRTVIEAQVAYGGLPVPVRSLMMKHHKKRLPGIPVFQPFNTFIGNDIRNIAIYGDQPFRGYKIRTIIFTLSR